MDDTDLDTNLETDLAALLAECKKVGPSEIIHDEAFEPTADGRF